MISDKKFYWIMFSVITVASIVIGWQSGNFILSLIAFFWFLFLSIFIVGCYVIYSLYSANRNGRSLKNMIELKRDESDESCEISDGMLF